MADFPLNTEEDPAVAAEEFPAGADDAVADAPADSSPEESENDAAEGADDEAAPARTSSLEEEGEIAADYLEELLDIADIDGDIDIDVVDGRAQVAIVSDGASGELAQLVGSGGRVVDALQELTRLTVQTSTGERSRLMLDVDNYRVGRREQLRDVATRAIEEVKGGAESVALPPMNAFERKIIHDVVAEAGLRSESDGQGEGRHVVVTQS